MNKKIQSALISVFDKNGLEDIVRHLHSLKIDIYTTGGTQTFIESLGIEVIRVEDLTGYPSILDGRVKTLHPKVFGGILAMRQEEHIAQLDTYEIPPIDLVIVDLYPFEKTVATSSDESEIIEKIDIGGISLIRAAAKNYKDVVVISSKTQYDTLNDILTKHNGHTELSQRKYLSAEAFKVSLHYDTAIFKYMSDKDQKKQTFQQSIKDHEVLRYGENPHQNGVFFGDMNEIFTRLCGKELSYNNLVDIDAALSLMQEFKDEPPTFAILKHTNACGVAVRHTVVEAWKTALSADPVSAFGGILITNASIDIEAALEIDKIFYEVLIAPDFTQDALALLMKKSKRIILKLKQFTTQTTVFKTLLNGVISQDNDLKTESSESLMVKTKLTPTENELHDLIFAAKLAKHLKSNTIVLAKDKMMLGMGCGQTSRVDACIQAIDKSKKYGFDLHGAVMASDAFFPFPDCVELGDNQGIKAVIQPGGSIKDQLSIDYCDEHGMSMTFTGIRHFRH